MAERAIRRVKEGTSAVLLQSGLDEVVVRFSEMLWLSAELSKPPGKWEISIWTKIWRIIQRIERESQCRNLVAIGEEFQPEETKDDEGITKDFLESPRSSERLLGYFKRFFLSSSYWTENFTRFMLLNETPLKGQNQPGEERLTKLPTTSRPDHIWPDALTRSGKIFEKLLFCAKDRVPEHAHGKPLFQITRAEVSEEIHLYWYCRRKTEFCVVLQFGTRIRSNEKIWKKALHLFLKGESWRMLSRLATQRICGTTFFE